MTAPAGSDLIGAIDHLADALLARVPGAESRPIPSLSALATGSLPAMRAYLDGRRADRRLDPLSGNEFRRRAVAIDSTFALAWFDLALQRVSLGGAALERAEMLSDRLPPRERDHLVALRALLEGRAPEAERLYRRLLARYPDDVEAWGMLGEVLLTYGGFYGRPIEDARRVFERVVALDPNVQRATYRLLNIAALEGRLGAFDSIATWVSEWSPAGSEDARLYTILGRLAGASPAERTTLLGEVEASASEAFLNGVSYYARQLGDVATLVWRNEARTDPVNAPGVQDRGHYQLALLESARGRFDVARRHLAALAEFNPGWALVLRASIAALPHSPDSAVELIPLRRRVSEWDTLSPPLSADSHIGGWADLILYLQGRLSLRLGDQAATRAVAKELEERGAFQDRGIPAAQLASALVALLAWQRDEPERALTALADAEVDLPLILRDSPFHTQALNRYVRGEVLYGLGRYRDALPWFESLNPGVEDDFMWLYFAPAQRRIAEIYERVGDPSRAAEHYRRFLELWRDADPALRPTVLEARRRMDALSNAAVVGTD